jgi:hypothetical protein
MTIRLLKHSVTNGTTKARVFYSHGHINRDGALRECVTIYAKDYDRALGKIFATYENGSDSMTDYFEQGHVRIFTTDAMYQQALALSAH